MISISGNNQKIEWREVYPETSPELLQILSDLLQINPYIRVTAKDCLKSKIFDKMRVPHLEQLNTKFIDYNEKIKTVDEYKAIIREKAEKMQIKN